MLVPKPGDLIRTSYVDEDIVFEARVQETMQVKRYNEDEVRVYCIITKVLHNDMVTLRVGDYKHVFPSEIQEIL